MAYRRTSRSRTGFASRRAPARRSPARRSSGRRAPARSGGNTVRVVIETAPGSVVARPFPGPNMPKRVPNGRAKF